ncbi:MAG: hypothetical protein NTW87_18220 [Planctomycetota bacterium]|nr:hypothetical protein [Planctomycetota bacterium]
MEARKNAKCSHPVTRAAVFSAGASSPHPTAWTNAARIANARIGLIPME